MAEIRKSPFNCVSYGTVVFNESDIVPQSMSFSIAGTDRTVSCADGSTHFFRVAIHKSAGFLVYGDRSGASSDAGESVIAVLRENERVFDSFEALVTAQYYSDSDVTQIRISSTGL